jgi:hypothetical protein
LISDTTPLLTWLASSSADVVGYQLNVDAGIQDVGDVVQHTPAPLADGNHTWTLAAYDEVRNTSVFTAIWSFEVDTVPPDILATVPVSGAAQIPRPSPLVITFTEPIEASSFAMNVVPDPGGWVVQWNGVGDVVTLNHDDFESHTTYTVTVSAANDMVGLPLAGAPRSWPFTTEVHQVFLPTVLRNP